MTKILITVVVFLTLNSFGQTPNDKSVSDITTTKSIEHINIPGTRVFIIPPTGFVISTTLPAIEKGNQGLLQSMDLVGGNFYTKAATFTKEEFEQKGIKVFEYKEFKINNFPAKIVLMQSDLQTKVYNLIFGDSTFSTSVMGIFTINDNKTGQQLKQAIESIYYDKEFKIQPFATATFKLDDTKSIFKFAKFTTTLFLYSIDGVNKESYKNEPYFMVLAIPSDGESLKTIADNMANVIKVGTIKNISKNQTNGLQSFKREIYGKLNGKDAVLFQHVVLNGESTVVMQGIAEDNFEKYIAEFAKLSNTVQKK